MKGDSFIGRSALERLRAAFLAAYIKGTGIGVATPTEIMTSVITSHNERMNSARKQNQKNCLNLQFFI